MAELMTILPGEPLKFGSVEFSGTTDTTAEGFRGLYAYTGTGSPVTLTIDTVDIAKGSATVPWVFRVKDQGGGGGGNSLTIATEGSETIDGAATLVISANYGVATLYSDGSNLFTL